tara:strand:+ start:149 stop:595 length:447 start_codon:yes stop_codon:yes gene_type:complete
MVRGAAGIFIVFGLSTLVRNLKSPVSIGNACPAGFAYYGDGNCKNVIENMFRVFNAQRDLHNYGWVCKKTLGLCNIGHVDWGTITEKAYTDWKCPLVEPGIGARNSCAIPKKRGITKNKLPMACRNGVWDKNHPKCRKGRIASPMDMD